VVRQPKGVLKKKNLSLDSWNWLRKKRWKYLSFSRKQLVTLLVGELLPVFNLDTGGEAGHQATVGLNRIMNYSKAIDCREFLVTYQCFATTPVMRLDQQWCRCNNACDNTTRDVGGTTPVTIPPGLLAEQLLWQYHLGCWRNSSCDNTTRMVGATTPETTPLGLLAQHLLWQYNQCIVTGWKIAILHLYLKKEHLLIHWIIGPYL